MSTTKRCYYETLEVERTADDSKLTQDARRLKRKMRSLVRSVTPAA